MEERLQSVRLGPTGGPVKRLIEFENEEQEEKCLAAWKGVAAQMEVDKQMPVLKALGVALGEERWWIERMVRGLAAGREVTPQAEKIASAVPDSGGSAAGGSAAGGAEESEVLKEIRSLRREMKSFDTSISRIDSTVSALQASVIVVQSRLGAVEKEQQIGVLLLVDVFKWLSEDVGGAARKRGRERALAEIPAAAAGAVTGTRNTGFELLGLLGGEYLGEVVAESGGVGDADLVEIPVPEEPTGAASAVRGGAAELNDGAGGLRMPRRKGRSEEEKAVEEIEKKKSEILECTDYLKEHWDESEWVQQCMDLVGKRLSTLQRMANSNAPKLAKLLVEKGVNWRPGDRGLGQMGVSSAVSVAIAVLALAVEWVLSLLGNKRFTKWKETKFCRGVLCVMEEMLAVLRVVQAFRWPLQKEHSAVAEVMQGDMQWCMVRTLDRMGDRCDEGEGVVYALLGEWVYVGSTVDPERRRRQHRSEAWVQQQVGKSRRQVELDGGGISSEAAMKRMKAEGGRTQKVYEEMKLKGAGSFGMVVMRMVVFKKVST